MNKHAFRPSRTILVLVLLSLSLFLFVGIFNVVCEQARTLNPVFRTDSAELYYYRPGTIVQPTANQFDWLLFASE